MISSEIENCLSILSADAYQVTQQEPELDQCRKLAKDGLYSDALEFLETLLAEEKGGAEVRLWWVHCQLNLKRVPITALAAALEELLSELNQISELDKFTAATFLKAALELNNRSHLKLAVLMGQHAFQFALKADDTSTELLEEVSKFLLKLLTEELERAKLRRETKKYLESLEEKLREHKSTKIPKRAKRKDKIAEKVESKLKPPSFLSAKLVASLAIVEEAPNLGTPLAQLNQNIEQAENQIPDLPYQLNEDIAVSDKSTLALSPPRKDTSHTFALIFFLLAISVPSAFYGIRFYNEHLLLKKLAMNVTSSNFSKMNLPHLPSPSQLTIARRGEASTLDEVGKRLEKLALTKKTEDSSEGTNSSSSSGEDLIDKAALDPKHAATLPAPSSAIGDELESMSNVPLAKNTIKRNKVPKIDPKRFGETKVEEIGNSSRKAPIDAHNTEGSSQTQVPEIPDTGIPIDADGNRIPNNQKALDGTPLRSYEVKRFDPPLLYRTVTKTVVLSAPSLLAANLAYLQPETPVKVNSRIGQWLEVVSSTGKLGYIYAQDAIEASR